MAEEEAEEVEWALWERNLYAGQESRPLTEK